MVSTTEDSKTLSLYKNLNVICINSWVVISGLRLFPSQSVWSEPDRTLPSLPIFSQKHETSVWAQSSGARTEIYRNWAIARITDWGLVLVTNIMINQWFSVKDQDQQNPMFSEACQGPTLKNLISEPINRLPNNRISRRSGLTIFIFDENAGGSI